MDRVTPRHRPGLVPAAFARRSHAPQPPPDKPKREAILDLSKYANNRIRVKFTGGREGLHHPLLFFSLSNPIPVSGILKGYDQLLNLVLDDVEEQLQGKILLDQRACGVPTTQPEPEPHTRALGLVVLRGPTITLLSPVDGSEEISNPFVNQEE